MPELPEVETVVRDLRPLLVGRALTAVRAGEKNLRRPWQPAWAEKVVGATVAAVRRRGKWIVVELVSPSAVSREAKPSAETTSRAGGPSPAGRSPRARPRLAANQSAESALLVHLGMTGQFTVTPAADPLVDHTHVVFDLDDGAHLRFRDIRRFGSVEWFPGGAAVEAFLSDRLGPEPFDLDPAAFRAAVNGSTRPVKAILLDQTVAAGVGNIYADEALHRAGLHPERRGPTVTAAEADRLREAVARVLTDAIENRGSTIRDYVGGSGLKGGYQDEHRVYGRAGKPCPGCAAAIEVVRVAGRSSHYCPACQPAAGSAVSREAEPSAARGRRRSRSAPPRG